MIAIIDYGMGNLYSVEKAFARLGARVVVTSEAKAIAQADKVVLPGVGAFGDCMKNLRSSGLIPVIESVIAGGKPFLGICLGLQLLFEGSEEDPGVDGLGIFAGQVRKITAPDLKIPHMGWNSLAFQQTSPLFKGVDAGSYVYFVHSYHAVPEADIVTAVADYGQTVTAAVGRDNVQAVQFHPEKSSSVGLSILANFVKL
ncbi:imidazole glycerol phosphate synthase subunit HisH|nr:imidazole glycerol phosphate synthase subunit HisH [Dendrosporobacter quercicolus]NSL47465.1 imidazole glycerol phosphate synthase subunit HisH [Dendrosporobacter quercicolus DSM 1736]